MNDETKGFSQIEISILKSKGVDDAGLEKLTQLGVQSMNDFQVVKDTKTLQDLTGFEVSVAKNVMQWAVGDSSDTVSTKNNADVGINQTVIRTDEGVYCFHCDAKQPKDYQSGDLCTKCGKQAEPTSTCHWCGSMGPGKFCRSCATEFVPVGELELAILLKREGHAKDTIAQQLKDMGDADKAILWGRARR